MAIPTSYYEQAKATHQIDSKQSPQLQQQIAVLEKAIYALRDSMGQLGERLLPVSYAVPSIPEAQLCGSPDQAPTSPIVDHLKSLQQVLWDMNKRVQCQLENMDL